MGADIEPCNASRSQQWNREHCRDAFYNDGLTHANHQKLAALCTKKYQIQKQKTHEHCVLVPGLPLQQPLDCTASVPLDFRCKIHNFKK
jgi:hypothetical protein